MKKNIKITLLIAIILLNVLLAFQPHFSDPYPLISDEYVHISLGKYISEEKQLPFTNPYLYMEEKFTNLESGFHFFLSIVFSIIPGDPILYYKYFVIFFMIINSLLLFYLTLLWFNNYYISLFSIMFFGMIRSQGNFLAHNYFLPLTLGIALLLILFIFLKKYEESNSKKYLSLLVVSLVIALFVYPPTVTFFGMVFLAYTLSLDHNLNKKFNLNKKKFFLISLIMSLILIILGILILNYLNLHQVIILDNSWASSQNNLSPVFFFGLPSVFFLIGLYNLDKFKGNKIIFYWIIVSILQIFSFIIFNKIFLIPFQRLFLFFLIGVSILAGFGFFISMKYLKLITNSKWAVYLLIFLIILNYLSLFANPIQYREIMGEDLYKGLEYLNKNYPDKKYVLTDPLTSIVIYPVTSKKVYGLLNSNIGGGAILLMNEFSSGNCGNKLEIIKNHFTKEQLSTLSPVFLTEEKIDCGFMNLIYEDNIYIYEPNTELIYQN